MISRKEMRTTSQDSGQAKRIGCLNNPTLQLKVFLNKEYCATCAAIACGGELQECLERAMIHKREVLDKVCKSETVKPLQTNRDIRMMRGWLKLCIPVMAPAARPSLDLF